MVVDWVGGGCLDGLLLGQDVDVAEDGLVFAVLVWVLVFRGGSGLICSSCWLWVGLC